MRTLLALFLVLLCLTFTYSQEARLLQAEATTTAETAAGDAANSEEQEGTSLDVTLLSQEEINQIVLPQFVVSDSLLNSFIQLENQELLTSS